MNSNNNMIELQMELPIEHEKKVFGQFDEHIKILERSLAVTLISRDGVLKIVGPASNAARAKECLTQLLELSRRGNDITTQNVNYAISLVMEDSGSSLAEIDSDCICHTVAGRPVKPSFSPASIAGRVRIIRPTSSFRNAVIAIAIARYVFPVPAGPTPKTTIFSRIASTYAF